MFSEKNYFLQLDIVPYKENVLDIVPYKEQLLWITAFSFELLFH